MKITKKPVFYDQSGLRGKLLLLIFFLLASGFGLVVSFSTVNILKQTSLTKVAIVDLDEDQAITPVVIAPAEPGTVSFNQLKLDIQAANLTAPVNQDPIVNSIDQANPTNLTNPIDPANATNQTDQTNPTNLTNPTTPEVLAFYVNWDDKSYISLTQNYEHITKLVPEWLHLDTSFGQIAVDDRSKQIEALTFIQKNKPAIKILPLINNYNVNNGTWDSNLLSQVLINPQARETLITGLNTYVTANNFNGITIDFENYAPELNTYLATFMDELSAKFHESNLQVYLAVPINEDAFNYAEMAKHTDYMILMAYDEHSAISVPGPIASHYWFSTYMAKRAVDVPKEKMIVALGAYGYDWEANQPEGVEITYQDAMRLAQSTNNNVIYNSYFLSPSISYTDAKGVGHEAWFLDGVSLFNQLAVTINVNPSGYALWRLGAEDPSVWSILKNLAAPKLDMLSALHTIAPGYGVQAIGSGEILESLNYAQPGSRSLAYDNLSGLIYDNKVITFSTPTQVKSKGRADIRQLALTFDDGPDANYTPKILDILKKHAVKATFFITGANANLNPDILKRIYAEGHEIGNHTFSHPDISKISPEQFDLELNSTQALLRSKLGITTLLFRPPYGEDALPQNEAEVKILKHVLDAGYFSILMGLDPHDWAKPGAAKIVEATIDQVKNQKGTIILLHDAGGDRTQTVEALPVLIEKLQASGYTFGTVSNLMGLTRDQVMPKEVATQSFSFSSLGSNIGFNLVEYTYKALKFTFYAGTVLGIYRLWIIIALAIVQKAKKTKFARAKKVEPISVLIPAYNEEKVIIRAVNKVLASNYKALEVIVIDDGSTDSTYATAKNYFAGNDQVKVLKTPKNVGKSQALNLGVAASKNALVFIQDADSTLMPDAILHMVKHFSDKKVGAVAGNVKVGNQVNLLTNLQALEYITSQNLDRRAFDLLNCITVVPGAIGAWRKQAIKKAGGFNSLTLTEDGELTIRLLAQGYKIAYEENAVVYTEAPQDITAFLKQRFRWMFGTLQSLVLHINMLFNPKFGFLGMFSLPHVLIFHLLFSLAGPFIDLYFVASIAITLVQKYFHPTFPLDTLRINLLAYLLFLGVDFITQTIAFALEKNRNYKLILWLPLQRIFYRQLLYFVAVKTIITALTGSFVGWNKLQRSGILNQGQLN